MRPLRHLGGSRDQNTCPYPAIIQDKIVMPAYTWYAGLALVWLMDAGVHACTGFSVSSRPYPESSPRQRPTLM